MINDIKEILDYYKKDNEEFEEFMIKNFNQHQLETTFHDMYQRYKNHKVLLDCITNLQEKNEKLNNIINELEKWLIEQKIFIQTLDLMPNLKEIKLEHKIMFNDYNNTLDKLKELKGE